MLSLKVKIILFSQSPACKMNQMSSTVVRGGTRRQAVVRITDYIALQQTI